MLNPKKTIPTLAVTALALTGCGDSGGSSGGAGGNGGGAGGVGGESAPTAFEAWCMFREDCSEMAATPTPTPPVCSDGGELPEGCEESLESYFRCWSEQSCDTLTGNPYVCEADINEILRCLGG